MRNSVATFRSVDVNGTTWTTDGEWSSTIWAETTTTGCGKPASLPMGTPRSAFITSPEVSIEPRVLVGIQGNGQILAHLLLAESSNGDADCFSDGHLKC